MAHIITNAATRKNQKGGYGLSSNRIKVYRTFQSIVQTYENELGHAIYIRDIDPEFIKSFTDWLMKSSYALSTIGKFIANFKTVCNDASLNGLKTSSQLKLIKVINERKDNEQIICLSFEELDKIEKLKLKKKYLLNARDWLILGCYVGQRGGDLLSLAKNNIKQLKDLKILELEQQKTGKQVVVPLYSKALEITERGFPYSIPLQKFNNHIKELCKIAGIDTPTKGKIMDAKTNRKKPGVYPKHQLVSSHICRRSFATNFYGQIPTPILMSITGHATEDMFLQYIGKTRYDNAYQMVEYFNKLNV
ncbi:MAG: phage integrase SAM-like domain-containing protein [Flavobacteriales bacterium]|nr:phage integrase SAM-like domain-containing protein [Flavobacteriales bacterium]